ncbi:MAG: protein-L-isoaspartate(D-aspartate) O-methyltransferase [Verrucomicrobiales bacterium]|jgi:protein-L-isoaspartate(D-aspartate) O-methyltransferase|nr:protein-L-isoaspartate(D-aspartate) O-methyltransferase [Verrucomicrobiales bacterium]
MKSAFSLVLLFGILSPWIAASSEENAYESSREAMIEEQLTRAGRDIRDERVLKAMAKVPRHEFVPKWQQRFAYEDRPLAIGYDQTISQPFIVAYMTEQLQPRPEDKVLEVGTGSGYQAAVLAELVDEVYSIEIVEPLAEEAARTLKRLGYENVHTRAGDGYKGWPEKAPFDAIIVTCAPEEIPEALVEQLKEGGRMMIPVGPVEAPQKLYLLEKRNDRIEKKAVMDVRFVPMTGGE